MEFFPFFFCFLSYNNIMKKNEVFIGICSGYDNDGLGVVKHQGFVLFVKGLLIGEEAEIICTLVKKNYGYGKILRLISVSKNRNEKKCEVYKTCGGCMLWHMNDYEQQYFKTEKVKNCFSSIAGMDVEVLDTIKMDEPIRYRNKVQVPVGVFDDKIKMGFYKNRTNEIVEFSDCFVQSELSNKIIDFFKFELNKYDFKNDIRHILIKHAHKKNEVMVVIICRKILHEYNEFLKKLVSTFKEIKSVICNLNDRKDNVILGDKEIVLFGESVIKEELCGLIFNISSKSFFQINPYQTEILYNKAIEFAKIGSGDTVLDLYCGIGTIGMVASKYAKKVIGIEIVSEAIGDAKINAKNNNIKNIDFYCMDAGEGAKKIVDEKIDIDVVIVDPPRKGLDNLAIESILKINPEKIVYVSCDPATLARDCKIFSEKGYTIDIVQPIDMFPHTSHVECIALIQRVK